MKAAILTDTTKCNGCHECVAACKKQNHLPADVPRRWDLEDGLSADNWTSIVEGPERTLARKQCRHCLEPACVSVCPVGALHKTDLGAVVYDASKCMGCRYCMMACPYGIPRYEWQAAVPYVRKCIFCYNRLAAGGQPSCTEACPTKAPAGALIQVKHYQAIAYAEAMHRLCLGCHTQKAKEKNKPEMTRCDWCHKERRDIIDARDVVLRRRGLMGQDVVLPPAITPLKFQAR